MNAPESKPNRAAYLSIYPHEAKFFDVRGLKMPKKDQYPLLQRSTVAKMLPLIDAQNVSLAARGRIPSATPQGFTQAFFNNALDEMATVRTTYMERRRGYISRAYTAKTRLYTAAGEPTRAHLALIAWAYSPDPQGLKKYISQSNAKNRQHRQYLGR